ncbi:hypothetical protein M2322_002686 [Rhodoblastus acidophilus]|nr:hypothetical protein [Rhodoblastus acidophilus]
MCFSSPSVPAAVAPAAAAPAPSPLAEVTNPTATRDNQDVEQYGAGGQPNMRRSDKSLTGAGLGAGGAGIGTSGGPAAGIAM